MEDSSAMTIEFLRARLLSERSISRSARQKAEELAKKVAELEEQLKIVSLQRKKAEKATADVLAILENYETSDVSEELDLSSDREVEVHLCESEVFVPIKEEDTIANSKVRGNDMEKLSDSEIRSSSLTGRSLSWKGTKCSHSLERMHMNSASRKQDTFLSIDSSSPQIQHRHGKSCRRNRPGDTRSAIEEGKTNNSMCDSQSNGPASHSESLPGCFNSGCDSLGDGSEIIEEEWPLSNFISNGLENTKDVSGGSHFLLKHGGKDMEKALEHRAQLIGQYEAEEKTQREWEEKFRENTSSTPDSCEPGNQSDVTEERDETKALNTVAPSQDRETKPGNGGDYPRKNTLNGVPTHSHAQESLTPEFAFPTVERTQDRQYPKNADSNHPPPRSSNMHREAEDSRGSQLDGADSSPCGGHASSKGESSSSLKESPEPPVEVGRALEALQQARSSLMEKLKRGRSLEGQAVGSMKAGGGEDIPVGCAGFFRIPTEQSASSSNQFLASPYMDGGGTISSQRPFADPHLDAFPSSLRAVTYPGLTPRSPGPTVEERAFSNFHSSRYGGAPPVDKLSLSLYEHGRHNMYR